MKPNSMSEREWIIKKLSLKLMIPERIVNVVITDQFDQAYAAVNNNNSIEFSGFGKFLFNEKRGKKRMEQYLSQKSSYEAKLKEDLSETAKRNLLARLSTTEMNIKSLKPKLNEL